MINIEEKLKKAEPTSLSNTERQEILRYIKSDIEDSVESLTVSNLLVSKYRNMKKSFLMKVVAGVLIFTGSIATAFASNDARPGDILFTVDRAIENLQLALTIDDGREAELKLQFAQERLQEVSELIEEFKLEQEAKEAQEAESDSSVAGGTASSAATTTQSNISTNNTATSTQAHTLEVEADVFTDITLVKVELRNGTKELFETTAKTREEIVDEIVSRFSLVRSEVDAVLSFEIEDRASRSNDRRIGGSDDSDVGNTSSDDRDEIDDNNIALATSIALEFLEDIKSDFVLNDDANAIGLVDDLLESFEERLNVLPDNVSIKIELNKNKNRVRFEIKSDDDNGKKIRLKIKDSKIEIRDGDSRIKIKIKKGGRVRIETRDKKSDDHNDDEDNDDNDDDNKHDDDDSDDEDNDDSISDTNQNDNSSNEDSFSENDESNSSNSNNESNNNILNDTQNDNSSNDSLNNTQNDDSDDDDSQTSDDSNNDQIGDDSDKNKDDDGINDNEGDDDSDDNSNNDSDDDSVDISQNSRDIKIKAEVKKGKTKVEVKINGDKDKFTLDTTARVDVVSHVASVYNIATVLVESLIDFEN